MMPRPGAPGQGFAVGAPADPRGSHLRPVRFGGTGVLSAPPRRRGPRGSTVAVAIATVLIVLAGCGGMWAASATARANMLPGEPLDDVAVQIGTHLDSADDRWSGDLVPSLAAQFTDTGSRPFAGAVTALDALGVTRTTTISPNTWDLPDDPTAKDRPRDTADAAIKSTLTLADGSKLTLNADGVFVRGFYYDGSDQPGPSRTDEDPTAVAPWALATLKATYPTSTIQGLGESCLDPMAAMVALSTVARTTGALASTCAIGGSDVALASGLDAAAIAAAFPVLGEYSALEQIPVLPGDPEEVGLVQYRFTAGEQNLIAVLASTEDFGWALVGIAGAGS